MEGLRRKLPYGNHYSILKLEYYWYHNWRTENCNDERNVGFNMTFICVEQNSNLNSKQLVNYIAKCYEGQRRSSINKNITADSRIYLQITMKMCCSENRYE